MPLDSVVENASRAHSGEVRGEDPALDSAVEPGDAPAVALEPAPAPAPASRNAAAPAPPSAPASIPNPKPMLAVLVVAALVASYNENSVSVALVQIMADFAVDAVLAQWLVSGYMVVTAVVAAASALLYRRLSVRRLFFLASACLTAGLVVQFLAPNFAVLFASRLVQAVGTGLCAPLMMSTMLVMAPPQKKGTYLAVGTCAITFGPAFAPVIGGVVVDAFGWRATALVPLAIIVADALAGIPLVRDVLPREKARVDAPSILLATVSLFCLAWGLSVITSQVALGIAVLAVALGTAALFVRRQTRIPEPLLDMGPVRNPQFRPALALIVVCMMTTFSLSVLLPLYYQQSCGAGADLSGLLLLGPLMVNALLTLCSGPLLDRRGPWPAIPLGFAFMLAGQGLLALTAPQCSMWPVFAASFLSYIGVGLSMTMVNTTGCTALPPKDYPLGSALFQLFIMIAASIAPALFTGVLSTVSGGQQAAGTAAAQAVANGFSAAMVVAAVIAAAGLALAVVYTLSARKRFAGER